MRLAIFAAVFLFVVARVSAERITSVNENGNTVIESVSVDQWTESWTIPITTETGKAKTTRSETESVTAETSSTANSTTAVATAVVSQGTIDDYSVYQASVSTELASITSSEWAAFTATATNLSLYTGSAGVASAPTVLWSVPALAACIVISCM